MTSRTLASLTSVSPLSGFATTLSILAVIQNASPFGVSPQVCREEILHSLPCGVDLQ